MQEDKLGEHIMNLLDELRAEAKKGTLKKLTMSDIPSLLGKRIQTIYFGYRGQDGENDFVVGDIISKWDLAKREDFSEIDEKFATRQDYWANYMTAEQIKEEQQKLTILTSKGEQTYINTDLRFDNGDFWCSDYGSVFFRVVDDEN